ncbi:tRNA cyclic N6-threonylcarbamoyladenosine(37) synthase TcdA [Herbaspirillum sp. VT-16-41]|uniref:tRNA cyclic N6-threonylcarbamoyladenosine(37) synthase TcdA n=1 Tax=Herbaspirillum sp. VT-16-41 TaxID=1953765 RepID=UPI000981B114|nr:tRNA cyclic N6-threonylcarbamoyladenosine(37) synthase TcdA [Herbaspirillum sp. VT-16-41]ONN64824.1 tRNA cyclic N6-threonylcarbamoyladenosine(37) synthase TcdA [Herbaspirillum sp. VT-16-41]
MSTSTDLHDIDYERRFGGVARLYGAAALHRFGRARVCVVGVGGVGSWIVEALARSAIGHLTLIDLDNLAESNVNRQIHALTETLGQAKVTALHERIRQINPTCVVTEVEDFVDPENVEQMLGGGRFDYVIDAIDNVPAKVAMIAWCRKNGMPMVTIGSAGGQIDPTQIEIRDLCRTEQEPLLAKVRKRLRSQHGFPRGTKNKFHIDAVFSTEPLRFPELAEGEVCEVAPAEDMDVGEDAADSTQAGVTGLNCAGFGSAMVVTATFGLVAAAHVLKKLAAQADIAAAAG